jgi:hypothetical protein
MPVKPCLNRFGYLSNPLEWGSNGVVGTTGKTTALEGGGTVQNQGARVHPVESIPRPMRLYS